jgi:RHS repeat-associated protein
MNPCSWLAAGGGAGGGGSAGGGSGGDGKANSKGEDGKADPQDGGKDAASCGAGANDGGGCPNHHGPGSSGGLTKGDPIDVVSGRVFTLPVAELSFPGPLPLRFDRIYSSTARERDVGFGPGWTHSLAWEIVEFRRSVALLSCDGIEYDFGGVDGGEAALGPNGWLLHREGEGFRLDLPNKQRYLFQRRTLEPSCIRYQLSALADEWNNRVELRYEGALLASLTDAVGRVVQLSRDAAGHIISLRATAGAEPQSLIFARYGYDGAGQLTTAIDADGNLTSYAYWDDHLLKSHTDPTGLTFFFRYDRSGRGIETWGEYPGASDPSLADDVPPKLADGSTPARGILHVKLDYPMELYSEAVDSIAVHTFQGDMQGVVGTAVTPLGSFLRTFDEQAQLSSFSDANGATTRFERDQLGRETKVVDPLGRVTQIRRDAGGAILEIVEPDDVRTHLDWDEQSLSWLDPLGGRYLVRFDARGQPVHMTWPDGRTQSMTRDAQGNVVEFVDERGLRTQARYDAWGRCSEAVDSEGRRTSFTFSNTDRLLAKVFPDGTSERTSYDGAGNPLTTTDRSGQTTRVAYGGFHKPVRIEKPNGEVIELRYNREGWLSYIQNGRDRRHRFIRDAAGLVVEERGFDDRSIGYRYDGVGRVVGVQGGDGQLIEYERDAAGQLSARNHPDGTRESFRYDGAGRVVEAESAAGRFLFTRNKRGWIVREEQVLAAGDAVTIRTDYSPTGEVLARRTSLGHSAQWTHDHARREIKLTLDGDVSVSVLDASGREIQRRLSAGAIVDFSRDAEGRLTERRVSRPDLPVSYGPKPPEWVGKFPPGTRRVDVFRYSHDGLLSEWWNPNDGERQYEYDAAGQLTAVVKDGQKVAAYRYDASGNLYDASEGARGRAYDLGDRIERDGPRAYAFDADGRLLQVTATLESGQQEIRRCEWSAAGRLAAVALADGSVISFEYDPFGRRMLKRVERSPKPGDAPVLVETIRFVWDGSALVHELKYRGEPRSESLLNERTYLFQPGSTIPIAHRDVRVEGEQRTPSPWWHYLNDDSGAPDALVAPDGSVACELPRDAWGLERAPAKGLTTTPIRFRGQYADDETGLFYNRHRYYDPSLGRYISADPLGIEGGLNAYAYAGNCPTSAIDPEGLMFSVIKDRDGKVVAYGHNLSEGGGVKDEDMHPALKQAGARGSCSETTALNGLANQLGPNASKEDVAKHFNEQGYTMETYEGNKSDYDKGVKLGANPCSACGKMLSDGLGINKGVMAPNRSKDKRKMKPWDGASGYTPVSRQQMADARRRR